MNFKIYLYFLVTFFVIIGLDSININVVFKKNKVFQARVFYFLLAFCMVYIITNLIYDFSTLINFN